jgi:hypothetical protein
MRSHLRTPAAAAAILLASLGGAFVTLPASAHMSMVPHHHEPQELLQRFEIVGVPAVGREIVFRVRGMEQGHAWVDVPGVMHEWGLPEVQPGVYESHYVISPRDNPAAFAGATATLQVWGTKVNARVGGAGSGPMEPGYETPQQAQAAARPLPPPPPPPRRDEREVRDPRDQRDTRGPDIGELLPANGERLAERGPTRIAARFDDDRSGVDRGSVRLRVDGRDVTGAARIDNNGIQYQQELQPGRHSAELTVRDRAGNETRRAWTFDVTDHGRHRGWDRDRDQDRRW